MGNPAAASRVLSMARTPEVRSRRVVRRAPEVGRLTPERRAVRFAGDSGDLNVLVDPLVQVVAHGDLPLFSILLPEPKRAPVLLRLEVADPQAAEGPDAAAGGDEGAENGAVADSDGDTEVDGGDEDPRLGDGDLGCLAVEDLVLDAPDRLEGFKTTAWRSTRMSKKCRMAASVWFLVASETVRERMKRPAMPGVICASSSRSESHHLKNQRTARA